MLSPCVNVVVIASAAEDYVAQRTVATAAASAATVATSVTAKLRSTDVADVFGCCQLKHARVLMLSLDAAGKTTILYQALLGEVVQTTPTCGFNVETIEHQDFRLNVWDLGGAEKIRRKLWPQFFGGADGIIFVVDSSDLDRIEEACDELHQLLYVPELARTAVLIYANKQDLPGALTAAELGARLDLGRARASMIQPSCAVTGDGVFEGLEWLAAQL